MKQNILALYLIKLSKWFSLVMPIIVLFYADGYWYENGKKTDNLARGPQGEKGVQILAQPK